MRTDFTSEACITCYKKPIHLHRISDSDGDSKLNIRHIICQHIWFKEDYLKSTNVCETYWKKVDQFHQFYLDMKKLHEHREVAPLSMFIKQEEITIEETQLQENCIDISAENQKLFDIADCKHEMIEELAEQTKKEELAEVPQPRKKRNNSKRLTNKIVVKNKTPHLRKRQTPEERQAEDDFIKKHVGYNCADCNIDFENFREIKYHRMKTHKKDTVMFYGTEYKSRFLLYQRVQSMLTPEGFKCEICGKSLKSKSGYDRHKELFHAAEEDLVFKCNRCPKSFIKDGLLKIHLAEHETLENETAKCQFCGKCFRTKKILNKHVKAVHKEPTDIICEVCSKGFYRRSMFLTHYKTHEFTAEQLKEQCPVCNIWLKNHPTWVIHVRRHKEAECKCEVCGHVLKNLNSLKIHMKHSHAPNRKRHVCEQCDKHYSRETYLKEHIANAHTRKHVHQCQHCEKKFFSNSSMYIHRRKDHPQAWLEDRMSKYARKENNSVGSETIS